MIRKFERADIPLMARLGRQYWESSNYKSLKYSIKKCHTLGEIMLTDKRYFAVVAEEESKITGMFMGYISDWPFGDEWIATDLLVYVDPAHRKGSTGLRMLKEFEQWAKEQGVNQLRPGTSVGNKKQLLSFYKRLGYKTVGYSFLKEIKDVK
jgi:GNAT superfamily N-acetyltransferase